MVPKRLARRLLAAAALLVAFAPAARAADRVPDSGLEAGVWGAPPGADPCGADALLAQRLRQDPELAARRDLFERMARQAEVQGLLKGAARRTTASGGTVYVIPVAVHIVHLGGPENISDAQVQSQLFAMNRDFANTPGKGAPAVNTGIQFCLAQNLPVGSTVTWSTLPGITRTNSPETNHTYGSLTSETNLKAIAYLPSAKYLNIWVVKTIAGGSGGVAGYGTYPGLNPPTLDGIVCLASAFGSNYTPYGSSFALLSGNDDGKIMTHECGHYLNLYHPFQGGCTPPGDNVSDTPPEAVNRSGCPTSSLTSCTTANDPIENFMDYTNDPCRWAFTAGQTARMQLAIGTYRAQLVSAQNLIDTGCSSGLNALISATTLQPCTSTTVSFSTPAAGTGYTYAWSFPGATPASATTQSASASWPAPGAYPVTLTVTDGGSNFSTNTATVWVTACSPILGPCTNWVFGSKNALSFATGAPVPVAGRQNASVEPGTAMSDGAGNLLYYVDGDQVWNKNNVVMPGSTGLLCGTSSHNGVLSIKRPGSSSQYLLFTIRQWEDGPTANPSNWTVIDMSLNAGLGDVPSGLKNQPVALPGSPNQLIEGQALIPHCNGTDWWWITSGSRTGSGQLYVTLVTAAGPTTTTAYNIGVAATGGTPAGTVCASADGSRIAVATLDSKQIAIYAFDRATGIPTTIVAPTAVQAWDDIAFSPNGKLVYFSTYDGTSYGAQQMDIASLQQRTILTNDLSAIEPGPDGKLYFGSSTNNGIHCVNLPDQFNTLNANECGLNPNAVPLPAGGSETIWGALPNMTQQCVQGGPQPAQFTYTVSNCVNVTFHAVNCQGAWTWNFGDSTGGSGQNVTHVYPAQGTYTVTLTAPSASPSVVQQTLVLQLLPVSIAGPTNVCPSPANYSAVGPSTYQYAWSVFGGAPATATGNNVDVTWGATGGTVLLVVTDPATGCTSHLAMPVGPCPVCTAPPLNMCAWWPMDEPSGAIAQETVAGNDGLDIGAPAHVPAKSRGGRQYNGTSNYDIVNDDPQVNFGTGDLTIDAWVKTTQASGFATIVDKRALDPAQGYALYLKNGRLALSLGDGTTTSGTEYWSGTTPLVADGLWHHVAAEAKRGITNGTRLFVDGTLAATFASFPSSGNVTNTQKLLIGAASPSATPVNLWNGAIDEVEFFKRALTQAEVSAIFLADSSGKCKEYGYVPTVTNICRDQSSVTVTLTICNNTTATQTYTVAAAALPASYPAATGCTFAGPTTLQVLGTSPYTVPANACVPVQIKIFKPAGMPFYATSCYRVTMTNTVTGVAFATIGSIYATHTFCTRIIGVGLPGGNLGPPSSLRYMVTNTGDGPVADVPYTLYAVPTDQDPAGEAPAVSVNGLDPGVAWPGHLTLAVGDSAEIDAAVHFTAPRSFRMYDVVLAFDTDGDGIADERVATGLRYQESAGAGLTAVPPAGPIPTDLRLAFVAPNPLADHAVVTFELPARGAVRIALFDLAGRRVRTVFEGERPAGPGAVPLDATGLRGGVYFLRLAWDGRTAIGRVVVLR